MKQKLFSFLPDMVLLLGVAALAYGFWLAWRPLGYIVGGLMLAAIGIFLDRNRAITVKLRRSM
jgi:hypothetical protein